jgi:hypothetical protein
VNVELQRTEDFVNHLRHCIQEEHHIELSEKAIRDITRTILGANRVATKGSIANMEVWQTRYYEQTKTNETLILGGFKHV